MPQCHADAGDDPASTSSGNLSRASTLTDPKLSSGTAYGPTASQKAQEDDRKRELQERAWREAEKRRRGTPAESWQGGLGPGARSS